MYIEFTATGARVRAEWLGAVRTVHEGTIWTALRFKSENA